MTRWLYYGMTAALTGAAVVATCPMPAYAAVTLEMRKKALVSANVIQNFDVSQSTTLISRGAFAKLLVMASTYRQSVADSSNVSVFADVPQDYEYAPYIRIAADNGWMQAYLGGQFRPEMPVKMNEANKACLTLLGYNAENFAGNAVANRNAKATAIGLKENIYKGINEELTWEDAVNLFYNLMTCNKASNDGASKSSATIYGSTLGFKLTDKGELNLLDTLEANLKGPYVLRYGKSLSSTIPFAESRANCYLNGAIASVADIESAAQEDMPVMLYYNSATKSVYAYSYEGVTADSLNTSGMRVDSGKITNIYYESTDIMIPTAIELDTGGKYYINSSDMQYAFSLYGSYSQGKKVTILYQYSVGDSKSYVLAVA